MNANFNQSISSNSGLHQSNRMAPSSELEEAKETLEILFEISQILNCGLDKQTLSILVSLCENGVNPEALAQVVKELQKEAMALRVAGER